MDCNKFDNLLADYQDGNLDPRQKAEFEEHLNLCPKCKLLYNNYKNTVNSLHLSAPVLFHLLCRQFAESVFLTGGRP